MRHLRSLVEHRRTLVDERIVCLAAEMPPLGSGDGKAAASESLSRLLVQENPGNNTRRFEAQTPLHLVQSRLRNQAYRNRMRKQLASCFFGASSVVCRVPWKAQEISIHGDG
jgi:hypothetical protein